MTGIVFCLYYFYIYIIMSGYSNLILPAGDGFNEKSSFYLRLKFPVSSFLSSSGSVYTISQKKTSKIVKGQILDPFGNTLLQAAAAATIRDKNIVETVDTSRTCLLCFN